MSEPITDKIVELSSKIPPSASNGSARCCAGDKPKAQQYFLETKGQIDLSMWIQKNEFIDAANWAFAQ